MRILHLIYDDVENPWVGGGGATRTLEMYSRIASMGHKVVVACGNYPGAKPRYMRRGIRYHHIGASGPYIWSRLSYMAGAVRLIKRGGYDIVIEDVSPFSPVGAPLWCGRAPAVATVQNLSGGHATAKYGPIGWGPKVTETPLLLLFKNFVAVSPGIATEIRRRTKSRNAAIRVIPNSVGEGFLSVQTHSGTGETRPYILSLGRIDVYQKGLDRLIAAFDLVAQSEQNIDLVIAGDGTQGQIDALKTLVGASAHTDRIRLAGKVRQAEAAELMRGAQFLAMPSRYEAWPLAAIEAGATGTPVVGSDIVGVKDAAPQFPRAHGILLPEGDIEALASAMLKLLRDDGLRRHLGERGQAWAARYSWDVLAQEQIAFYYDIVHNSQTPSIRRGNAEAKPEPHKRGR